MKLALLVRATIPVLLVMLGLHGQSGISLAASNSGISFRDCPECPEMVVLPAGEFVMGASADEEDREFLSPEFRNRSIPQRRVSIRSFSAGRYEVTRQQFQVFAEATGHRGEGCFSWVGGEYRMDPGKSWRNLGYPQNDRHPVSCVSWEDAAAYVQWLSARTGKPYRLLSEAEWEYAARGGNAAPRFWGEDSRQSCVFANGADQKILSTIGDAGSWPTIQCDDGYAYTAPVGSFRANPYGLHDMLGNVAEWTADCWNSSFNDAPSDGRVWMTGDCFLRAVRGGGWDEGAASLRSAYRVGSPVVVRVYSRGFRVALQN
jgi:formylglycine-generating enzyme required for sulfatase activity